MQHESYNAHQQSVMIEITRLWTGTDKRKNQEQDREALLSLFFQTAEKYQFMAVQRTVSHWIEDHRWWPSAVKDFEDALRTAQTADQPQLENHNDPWSQIRESSPMRWAQHLVRLYEEQHRGLSLPARLELEKQALNMVRDKGAGSFGVHPHPVWPPSKCLQVTRYA